MRVLVTGANGFIAKNLITHLQEKSIDFLKFTHDMKLEDISSEINKIDFVFHLAGVNRPKDDSEFSRDNSGFTEDLCAFIQRNNKKIPILFASSIQADVSNAYGKSKLAAEEALIKFHKETKSPVYIYRLLNVFGKWSRPNYNSVVATFCHNVANNLPLTINDPASKVNLIYIDDVIHNFLNIMLESPDGLLRPHLEPIYEITLGNLAKQIKSFLESRQNLMTESVGDGLTRALYATYLSALSPDQFSYALETHNDPRGKFVEFLKTKDSGQFSFFTAHPGVTRGGHYHHTKNEKFLVVEGTARFGFRHVVTGETYELFVDGSSPKVIESIPGWAHDITNTGKSDMIVMLWANEIFDHKNPDTYQYKV